MSGYLTVANNPWGDWLMLVVTMAISGFFFYSMMSPKWLVQHWTPARWVYARRGKRGARILFFCVAILLAVLAIVQGIRFKSGSAVGPVGVLSDG